MTDSRDNAGKNGLPVNYVLVDYENVQPSNFEVLAGYPFKVIVFYGENQKNVSLKLPFGLVEKMQQRGTDVRYIGISGIGKNALDFHIAYYIGELSQQDKKAHFHIIAKDNGYDPLIRHLKSKKISVHRRKDLKVLANLPTLILKISSASSDEEKIQAIMEKLNIRGKSRPRKKDTLANRINCFFEEDLSEFELSAWIKKLESRNYIEVGDGGKIIYNLKDPS